MAKLLQLRRGTTSQHSSFTGAEGEVTVDTDKDTLVVHDNATAGGKPLATEAFANAVAHTGDVTGSQALTIATDAVDIAMLSATGTADATTFLRGDNAWAVAGGSTFSSLTLTPGSTPGSPAEGEIYYDSTADAVKVYNGSAWVFLTNLATGGVITTYTVGATNYMVHTFLTSGTFTPVSSGTVDYLVVAGGGGGGSYQAGGGGAGGFRTGTGLSVTVQAYPVIVGAYGAGQPGTKASTTIKGGNGSPSTFSSITSTGGGGGSTYHNSDSGGGLMEGENGGSGGGTGCDGWLDPGGDGINDGGTFGTATYQGHDGGANTGYGSPYGGGGGGGAGAVGTDAGSIDEIGHGGAGEDQVMGESVADSLTLLTNAGAGVVESDTYRYFAGGGGGGAYGSTSGINGGTGGGGSGSAGSAGAEQTAGTGTANTGSGGGGGGRNGIAGGNGGSGIVIIRYTI
jgi:hypothetical protein